MAKKKEDDLDLAVESTKVSGSSKPKLILMIAAGIVLLLAASVGTTLFIAKKFFINPIVGTVGNGAATAEAKPVKESIYVDLDPAFVVNFQDHGMIRFLQIGVQVMVNEQQTADGLKHHMPVVRNNLLLIFSSLNLASISDREGKEKLRETVLAEIRSILAERGVRGDVEAVYFTSFVMQ